VYIGDNYTSTIHNKYRETETDKSNNGTTDNKMLEVMDHIQ